MSYTPAEVRALTPVRRTIELRARQEPDLRDVFLCHAWDDRRGAATELHDLLVAQGVSVWFSEKDIVLGQPFLREIDRGLAKSRTGLVLVTPALLKRVDSRGVSDKELSELLARDLLIPVVQTRPTTTFGRSAHCWVRGTGSTLRMTRWQSSRRRSPNWSRLRPRSPRERPS